jgi:hypothetical protein
MANVIDLVLYADGIKIVFGDSPDGSERSAEHLGSYFMTMATAQRLQGMLNRVFRTHADQDQRAEDGQETDAKPVVTG